MRIVYHSAEFYKPMCTSMACRAGNYCCSLGLLFIIPSKYTAVSVRVTLINSLEVKAAVLSTVRLQLSLLKLLARRAKLSYCYSRFVRKLSFYSCSGGFFWFGFFLLVFLFVCLFSCLFVLGGVGFSLIIFKAISAITSK